MNTGNKLTIAVRKALMVGVVASVAMTTQANANNAAEGKVERIEVTGSRINRTDVE